MPYFGSRILAFNHVAHVGLFLLEEMMPNSSAIPAPCGYDFKPNAAVLKHARCARERKDTDCHGTRMSSLHSASLTERGVPLSLYPILRKLYPHPAAQETHRRSNCG